MAASFPAAAKSWTPVVDNVTEAQAVDVNTIYDEVTAIETELGTDPAGTATDVKTRLARSLDGVGNLDFSTSGALTIASGSITPTQNWHTMDTEGSAATDDLATIATTNVTDGFILFLRDADDSRDITIKHAAGNIYNPRQVDVTLDSTSQIAMFMYDATLTKWILISARANAVLTNASNTFTLENIFSASVRFAYTTSAINITLDATHNVVDIDASGGTKTVTLPAAASITGRQYTIRKSDSSGNAVTIDGNSTETINGAATKSLAAQYDTATIMSNGTNWIVI
jgi:hypothetical protein